jgi:hypothetical protein
MKKITVLKKCFLYGPAIAATAAIMMACTENTPESVLPKFTKQVIHPEFISEGVATADVNKDGRKDILAGNWWFEAPDWTPHEIQPPQTFDYTKGYSNSFLNFTLDVNQDGWMDLIRFDFPGQGVYWYENPKGKEGHWKEYLIDSTACNESPMMQDVDGDGRDDLVFGRESTGEMMWFRPPAEVGDSTWQAVALGAPGLPGSGRFSHGLGFGDMNNDGRKDIFVREGWWEAPADRMQTPWPFHPAPLGEPCSQMYSYDFDLDGDQDVVSASAHAYGIWWHEQVQRDGKRTFDRHLIDSTFSQTHGVAFLDMNADELPDLITGKRFFAHQGKDPGGLEPAVLYWFEFQRDEKNRPQWIPHLIDDDSGAGLQVIVEDINGDGKLDILNANKKGVICFWGVD